MASRRAEGTSRIPSAAIRFRCGSRLWTSVSGTRHRVCVSETCTFELAVFRVVGFKIKVSSDDGSEICSFSLQFLHFLDEHANLIEPSFLILLQGGNNGFEVLTLYLSLIHSFVDFLNKKGIPLDTGVQMQTDRKNFSPVPGFSTSAIRAYRSSPVCTPV